MTANLEPVAVEYEVSPVPADHHSYHHLAVAIRLRRDDWWVVTRPGQWSPTPYLNKDLEWSWGSEDSDEWRAVHWHTWDGAVALAKRAVAS